MNPTTTLALTPERQLCNALVQQLQQTIELFMVVKRGVWQMSQTSPQQVACLISLALHLERQMDLLAEHSLRLGASMEGPAFQVKPPSTLQMDWLSTVAKSCGQYRERLSQVSALSTVCQQQAIFLVLKEHTMVLDAAVWQLEEWAAQPRAFQTAPTAPQAV